MLWTWCFRPNSSKGKRKSQVYIHIWRDQSLKILWNINKLTEVCSETPFSKNLWFCGFYPPPTPSIIKKNCQILWDHIFFLTYLLVDKSLWGELKLNEGVIYITTISIHYFIYLETTNTQKSEFFLLRISLGNVNASGVVICQYLQIYWKRSLEKVYFLWFWAFTHMFVQVFMTFCYHTTWIG